VEPLKPLDGTTEDIKGKALPPETMLSLSLVTIELSFRPLSSLIFITIRMKLPRKINVINNNIALFMIRCLLLKENPPESSIQ